MIQVFGAVKVDRSLNMAGILVSSDCNLWADRRIRKSNIRIKGEPSFTPVLFELRSDATLIEALEDLAQSQRKVEVADFAELMAFNNTYPEEKEAGSIFGPRTIFEDRAYNTRNMAYIYVYDGQEGQERHIALCSINSTLWKGSRILLRMVE